MLDTPAVYSVWKELLEHDRARDAESFMKTVTKFFLVAVSHRHAPTFASVEELLRAESANTHLVACAFSRLNAPNVQCFHPIFPQKKNCAHYVSICVEGKESADKEKQAQGYKSDAENMQRLAETGFLVFGNRDTDTNYCKIGEMFPNSHLQLDSELSIDVPHCVSCRRLPSPLVVMSQHACGCSLPVIVCSTTCYEQHLQEHHAK
jgi:hypothetical protein